MNDSFSIELQTARASIERHGVQPPFQLPWEKGIWKRIFNPNSSHLSIISRSLPLPSSFSSSASSYSPLNSFPNSNSTFSQLHAFDTSFGEKGATHYTMSSTTAVPSAEFWSKFFNRSDLQQGRVDGLRKIYFNACFFHGIINVFELLGPLGLTCKLLSCRFHESNQHVDQKVP